jgi:hypothetical protein
MSEAESKVLTAALYQCRILLARYLGSQNDAAIEVRLAAHLAYALHNDALAVMDGRGFDVQASLKRIAQIDQIIGGGEAREIAATIWKALLDQGSGPTA